MVKHRSIASRQHLKFKNRAVAALPALKLNNCAREAGSVQEEPRNRRDRGSARRDTETSEAHKARNARDMEGDNASKRRRGADSAPRAPAEVLGRAAQTENQPRDQSRLPNQSPELSSSASQPSTATLAPGSLRAVFEAEPEDITVNHPSMMPADDRIDESIPQEGCGAIDDDLSEGEEDDVNHEDVDEITAERRTIVSPADDEEPSRLEQPSKGVDNTDEITPRRVPTIDRGDNIGIPGRKESLTGGKVAEKRSPGPASIAGKQRAVALSSPRARTEVGVDVDAVNSALGSDTPMNRRETRAAERDQATSAHSTRRRLFPEAEENIEVGGLMIQSTLLGRRWRPWKR